MSIYIYEICHQQKDGDFNCGFIEGREDEEICEECSKEEITEPLQPIVGQHLLSFPENSPAPFELLVKDGHNLILFDPSGDSVLIPKQKFLATLIKLHNEGKNGKGVK